MYAQKILDKEPGKGLPGSRPPIPLWTTGFELVAKEWTLWSERNEWNHCETMEVHPWARGRPKNEKGTEEVKLDRVHQSHLISVYLLVGTWGRC